MLSNETEAWLLELLREQWLLIVSGFGAAIATGIVTILYNAASTLGMTILEYLSVYIFATRKGFSFVANKIEVDLVLRDAEGKEAFYSKKLTARVIAEQLRQYTEGVSASAPEGAVGDFTTSVGNIVKVRDEHGYTLCDIDLGLSVRRGKIFSNRFTAKLLNTFGARDENWVQEIVYPTKRLVIHVHFPESRPPYRVTCGSVKGVRSTQERELEVATGQLGQPTVTLDVVRPRFGAVHQIRWSW